MYLYLQLFFTMYHIIKLISTHLLKRKLIKAEQYERVSILEAPQSVNDEWNGYPSLNWGLVALMIGLGFVLIEVLRLFDKEWIDGRHAVFPMGILLVFIPLGLLFNYERKESK